MTDPGSDPDGGHDVTAAEYRALLEEPSPSDETTEGREGVRGAKIRPPSASVEERRAYRRELYSLGGGAA